jgi:hypothetical protein
MSRAERDLMASVFRSGLFLTMIVLIPIALITGLLGPIPGMLAFAAAVPLSGQLGGSVPLGPDLVSALARARADIGRIGRVSGLAALFGFNVLLLIPAPAYAVPFLPVLVMSMFVMGLYTLGMRSPPERLLPDVAAPVLLLVLLTLPDL